MMLLPVLAIAVLYAWVVAKPRSLDSYIPQIETSIEDLYFFDLMTYLVQFHWALRASPQK